jgi:cytochrome P450 PksS
MTDAINNQNRDDRRIDTGGPDPYPHYARLRRAAPVLRVNRGPPNMWVVTRHREAVEVFKDRRFVRNYASLNAPADSASGRRSFARGFGRDMLELDPPDHTRLRRLVGKAFTPKVVQGLSGRIAELADQILDRAVARGEMELISEYASVVLITVITELLGVPVGDIGKFRAFIYPVMANTMLGRTSSALDEAKSRFTQHLHTVLAARRRAPRDDLVSALVQVEQEGERLSPDELIGMVYILLLGGFVYTVNVIGSGMLALLQHPEQLDMLRRNPGLADSAFDEFLRFESPLEMSAALFSSTDVELGGVPIPKGAQVRVLIPSANHDELQFAAPDALNITRNPCPHVSFGGGIHNCIGAALACLETKITMTRLIERAPNLRLGDPAQIKRDPYYPMLRGLQQLPLRL